MDRVNFFFRQLVTNDEMNDFEDKIEDADKKIVSEILGDGLITGGTVVEDSPISATEVQVAQTLARDTSGNRVNVQDLFADKVVCIVNGLTLQNDGIGVPSTVGTYLLFNSAPAAAPFTFVGRDIKLTKSPNEGNVGSFEVQQVVVTTWGGLIPSQIMVRINEELDEEGYTSGLAPTGTPVVGQILSAENAIAKVDKDEDGLSVLPTAGKERTVSLYARFARFEFDTRLDGNGLPVDFESVESFVFVVDGSTAEADPGLSVAPDLRTNGDVFLADVTHIEGSTIADAQIDTSRQVFMNLLTTVSEKLFEYVNSKFFGDKIAWNGTNFSSTGPIYISTPTNPNLTTVPVFDLVVNDGQVVYVVAPRGGSGSINAQVADRGTVPAGDATVLVYEMMGRVGDKMQGHWLGGELEIGEEGDVGDGISDDTFMFMGSTGETDNSPNYQTTATGAKNGQTQYNSVIGDNLTIRNSRLTTMMADKAQDKTIKALRSYDFALNTTNAANQELTFGGTSPTLKMVLPSSADATVIGLGGTLSLAAGEVAYFEVNRNAAVNIADLTGLTKIALASVPLNENAFIFAVREGDDIYLWDGTLIAKDGAPVYSPSDVALEVFSPTYATTAVGAKNGQTNYNAVAMEALSIRLSRITTMMADKAQDKTIKWLKNYESAVNATNVGDQEVTFTGTTPTLELTIPSSSDQASIGLGGTLALGAGEVAYFQIDRNAAVNIADLTGLTTAAIAAVPLTENVFIFAVREDDDVYLWDGTRLAPDGNPVFVAEEINTQVHFPTYGTTATGAKNGQTSYNSTAGELLATRVSKLTTMMADKAQDKTIQYLKNFVSALNVTNAAAQELTFKGTSPSLKVLLPSSADPVNITMTGTLSLAAGEVAYFAVNRNGVTNIASLAALTKAAVASVPLDENTHVFAVRDGDDIWLWDGTRIAKDGELVYSIEEIVRRTLRAEDSPVRLTASETPDEFINIGANLIEDADGTGKITPAIDGKLQDFPATKVGFQGGGVVGAGTVFVDGGAFVLPDSTVGQIRRVGFNYLPDGAINMIFSDETASLGAQADRSELFIDDSLPSGLIELEATATASPGEYKTIGSSTAVIENNPAGTPRVVKIAAGGGAGGGKLNDFRLKAISGTELTLGKGIQTLMGGQKLITGDDTLAENLPLDLFLNLDTILGSTPAANTAYWLYVDKFSLEDPFQLTDSLDEVIRVKDESNFALLTVNPEDVNRFRYLPVGPIRSSTGGDWDGALSQFSTEPVVRESHDGRLFSQTEKNENVTTTAEASVVWNHGLLGKPDQITVLYDDGSTEVPVDASNVVTDVDENQITYSTLAYAFGGGESLTVKAIFAAPPAGNISMSQKQPEFGPFTDTATTVLPHNLTDADIKGMTLIEHDVTADRKRILPVTTLLQDYDGTNLYFDWAGLSPSATLTFTLIVGGSTVIASVPFQFGGYTKFVGNGVGSFTSVALAVAASGPGDSILVNKSYEVAAQEVIAADDIRIDFMPGVVIRNTAAIAESVWKITGSRVDVKGLNLESEFAGTQDVSLLVEGNDCNVVESRVNCVGGGTTITDVFKVEVGALRNHLNASVRSTSGGTVTNTVLDNGTDTGLGIRG